MNSKELAARSLGGLLYCPASNTTVAEHIIDNSWPCLTSMSLCLEDSVADSGLKQAEEQLVRTLKQLREAAPARMPMLFVRVRGPEHLQHVHKLLGSLEELLMGYVFPKFDLVNADAYFDTLRRINDKRKHLFYAMPILESPAVAGMLTRKKTLEKLRKKVDAQEELVLNIRVGANDLCNLYGLRRGIGQTVYELPVIRDILVDILNVFSTDHVVSGPVWEYYSEDPESAAVQGLKRELRMDRAAGFQGKTCIHPSQLPYVFESMKVSPEDAADARRVLNWSDDRLAVGAGEGRMNEVKCHSRWAQGIMTRAAVFGVTGE